MFDNSDKTQSPEGYRAFPQVVVTRQIALGRGSQVAHKYYVNGHVTQAKQYASLFKSVQLNINNPHFVILQGRITKVLSMKPQEILSMVEEAAGTRMFEESRRHAERDIEKKQKKVEDTTLVWCSSALFLMTPDRPCSSR